jgi:hypothetical protein
MRRTQLVGALAIALMLALLSACHGRETLRQEPVPNPSGFTVQWVHAPSLDYDSFSDPTGHIRAYDQHAGGKQPGEVLDFERWKSTYFDSVVKGGRPGRAGGPSQVATRQQLATEEGYINSESTRLGDKVVDMYRSNAQGGIDYVEVDSILQNGLPRAAMREKLKVELRALGRNDTLLIVDKEEPLKRILYRFGEDASVVDTRRVGGE